jgi:hypothetical protein
MLRVNAVAAGLVIAVIGLALTAPGCGKGKNAGATCDAVGARFLAVARKQLDDASKAGDLEGETRTRIDNHIPAIRDAMVRACKENAWTAEVRACFASADDDGKMKACYQAMPPEQRALLEKAAAGKLGE